MGDASQQRHIPASLDENFRFMVLEVRKQVEETLGFVTEPEPALLERIIGRDDYIDSMKSLIGEKTFEHLAVQPVGRETTNLLRCLNTLATNLERIGDFAVNVVRQMRYLTDLRSLASYDYQPFFDEVLSGLEMMVPALRRRDPSLALRICQCEHRLDELYTAVLQRILGELCSGINTGDLVTCLFIFRYLERMGDSLLNIGEALILVVVGEPLKIHQYQALRDSLSASDLKAPLSGVEFSSFWGNRSGCRVGSVADGHDANRAHRVIFKEGQRAKILREKENIDRWQDVAPGLVPRVFGLQENETQASLLLEFLNGCTFQDCLLDAGGEALEHATSLLTETMSTIWQATRRDESGQSGFIAQLLNRLEDVYRVHPRFQRPDRQISDLEIPALGQLLKRMQELEPELPTPFTVLIHGDFNLNNIIYDHKGQRLHFIDLYRSAHKDYVQDVSVFLASCFRLPIREKDLRARLTATAFKFLEFTRQFAQSAGDAAFEARLALGLIRSFFTSTRFELDEGFASDMYMRALYLMEKLDTHQGRPWPDFRVPDQVLRS